MNVKRIIHFTDKNPLTIREFGFWIVGDFFC